MTIYFKATRPNGTDFNTGRIDYAKGLETGEPVKHPHARRGSEDATDYLSISTLATDCTGFSWPARLFEVKPVGRVWTPHKDTLPHKRAAAGVTVVKELPAHLLFGPQGEQIVALLDQFAKLSLKDREALYRGRPLNWYDAYRAVALRDGHAGRAGLGAARCALGFRLGDWRGDGSAYGAALALLCRHLIGNGFTQTQYDTLAAPWVKVTGQKLHPEDVTF